MAQFNLIKSVLILVLSVLLTSCGGGGGGGGGSSSGPTSSGSSTGGTPAASISLSTHTVEVTANANGYAPVSTLIITVTNRPSGTLYLANTETTNAITSVSEDGQTANTAQVVVNFKSPASLALGVHTDTIRLYVCTDATCTTQLSGSPQTVTVTFTVDAAPAAPPGLSLISLNPSSVPAGIPTFPLTVTGNNFTSTDVVEILGAPFPTTMESTTQLAVTVPMSYTDGPSNLSVIVHDTATGDNSNPLTLTVVTPPAVSLRTIFPSQVRVGVSPPTLQIYGAGFGSTSAVEINGSLRATTFMNTGQLVAQLIPEDVATAGVLSVGVAYPGSVGSVVTGTVPLTVTSSDVDAVAYQINPAHTGAAQFQNVTLPSTPNWTITLGPSVTYPLIAAGKIYVTYGGYANLNSLIALDGTTGQVVWGPIVIGTQANIAYDNGRIFVASTSTDESGNPLTAVQAIDAGTGDQRWITPISTATSFQAPPTAMNGIVYVAGQESGEILALNESTGALLWTQPVENGQVSSPAVTSTGVYVDYPCQTYAFDPSSGTSLWHNAGPCEGGGGYTMAVANGLVYAPNNSSGSILSPITGATIGSFTEDLFAVPVISPQSVFYLTSGSLTAVSLSGGNTLWTFVGDGALGGSPVLVNDIVFVQSNFGHLYAVNANTGLLEWTQTLGQGPLVGSTVTSGMNAGDGFLVIPQGSSLTTYTLSNAP